MHTQILGISEKRGYPLGVGVPIQILENLFRSWSPYKILLHWKFDPSPNMFLLFLNPTLDRAGEIPCQLGRDGVDRFSRVGSPAPTVDGGNLAPPRGPKLL